MAKHLQHVRSSVNGKEPQVDQLVYGEISVNFNQGNEFLCIRTKNDDETVEDTIVSFRSWPYIKKVIEDNELVTTKSIMQLQNACGLNENLQFIPASDTKFINSTTNITEAINTLDKTIATSSENLEEIADTTASAVLACGLTPNEDGYPSYTPPTDANIIAEAQTLADAVNMIDKQSLSVDEKELLYTLPYFIIGGYEVTGLYFDEESGVLEYHPSESATIISGSTTLVEAVDKLDNAVSQISTPNRIIIDAEIQCETNNVQEGLANYYAQLKAADPFSDIILTNVKYYDYKANIAKVLSTYYNEIDDTIYLTLANPFDGLEGGVLVMDIFADGTFSINPKK